MSISGKKKQEINRDYILSRISSYDIFYYYYPFKKKFKLNRACKSPFTDDTHPSCIIGSKYGEVAFKCFNSEHRGDAFSFVMSLLGLTYRECLDRIAQDFGLNSGAIIKPGDIITYEQPIIENSPIFLQAESKPFTDADRKYLSQYHLSPRDLSFCKDTRAHSTLQWAINRKRQPLKRGEICFYYHLKNERGEWIKVYKPNADKKNKWRSSIPFSEMHGVGNISGGCKSGIITKSMKDGAFIAKYISPCVEIVQAEDYTAITPENMKRIKESCGTLYIAFDNDKTGKEASIALTKELGCKHINPPDSLLELGGSDFSDMGRILGVDAVIQHFKKKKVIV